MPATWYGGTLTSAASSSPAPMNSTVVDHVGREVAVPEHRRLRLARRAAREQQDGDVLGVGAELLVDRRGAVELGEEPRRARPARRRRSSRRGRRPLRSTIATDGRGAGEQRGELGVGEAVVERHERHAGEAAPEQQDRDGLGVGVDERRGCRRAVARPIGRPARAWSRSAGVGRAAPARGRRRCGRRSRRRPCREAWRVRTRRPDRSVRGGQGLGRLDAEAGSSPTVSPPSPASCRAPRARSPRGRSASRAACREVSASARPLGRSVAGQRVHRVPTTAQVDRCFGGADDDDLGVTHEAAKPHPGSDLHQPTAFHVSQYVISSTGRRGAGRKSSPV